jgi:hypothetical protein
LPSPGPSPCIYADLHYQEIIRPERIYNFGVGFSFADKIGGKTSGVNSYARLGLDFMFLVDYAHADKSTDWEMRIAPTFHGKLLGNAIGTVSIGPRFIGSDLKNPTLMTTLALSYDADTLVDALLTPPAPQTQASTAH